MHGQSQRQFQEQSEIIDSVFSFNRRKGKSTPHLIQLCRLVQYFCRFLATKYAEQYELIIAHRSTILEKKNKVESLMGAAAMARKILRFGPSINCIKTIILNLQAIASGKYSEPL